MIPEFATSGILLKYSIWQLVGTRLNAIQFNDALNPREP